jgi:hypothetical protein
MRSIAPFVPFIFMPAAIIAMLSSRRSPPEDKPEDDRGLRAQRASLYRARR